MSAPVEDAGAFLGTRMPAYAESAALMRNPHFDDGRLVWDDSYSGHYEPRVYAEQFELQWKIALDGNEEYYRYAGASVDDPDIDDRVYEWTGRHPSGRSGLGGIPRSRVACSITRSIRP